jgi:chromosome segregation ATPase
MDENKIRTELRVNREALAQLESELKQASENLTHVRRQLTEQLKGYTVTSAAAELARLSENDRKLKQIEDEIRKIREEAEKTKARISVLNDERSRLDADRIRLEADISGLLSQRQEKEKRLYELSQGADIEEGIKQIDDELDKLVQADKRYSTQIEQLEKEYNELNVNRSKLDSSVSLYSEGLAADSEKLQRALAESGFSSPEEAESYMIPGEQQKEIKAEIEAYDQEAVNIKAHRRLLETKLGSNRSWLMFLTNTDFTIRYPDC